MLEGDWGVEVLGGIGRINQEKRGSILLKNGETVLMGSEGAIAGLIS